MSRRKELDEQNLLEIVLGLFTPSHSVVLLQRLKLPFHGRATFPELGSHIPWSVRRLVANSVERWALIQI
jgi:hypothetical protein